MKRSPTLALIVGIALVLPVTGCYLYDEPVAADLDAYVPPYYQGNVVYFDNGEPYYFVGEELRYVPRDRPEYTRFREHYQRSAASYRRWALTHPPRRPLEGTSMERRSQQQEDWQYRRHTGERY